MNYIDCELIEEDDGTFSIISLNLPGLATQGENEMDAIMNMLSVYQDFIDSYREDEADIAWVEEEDYKYTYDDPLVVRIDFDTDDDDYSESDDE